jgi:hypothetical protein
MMGPDEWIRAVDFGKCHKMPFLTVENSFGQQVTEFPCTEYKYNRITQNGRSSVGRANFLFQSMYLLCWIQVTGALGMSLLTMHDYLYSCNNGLFVDIQIDEVEEQFLAEKDYYIYHYHYRILRYLIS